MALFGDNGHGIWPGQTLPAFTACEAAIDPELVKFKSIFRLRAFHHASEHMPTAPGSTPPCAVNTAGEALSSTPLLGPPRSRYRPIEAAIRGGAVVNHYATRSTDVFLMKNDRGFGTGRAFGKYHLNSVWHRRTNRNDLQDRTILRRWDEVAAEMARLRALPGVAAAEADCLQLVRNHPQAPSGARQHPPLDQRHRRMTPELTALALAGLLQAVQFALLPSPRTSSLAPATPPAPRDRPPSRQLSPSPAASSAR